MYYMIIFLISFAVGRTLSKEHMPPSALLMWMLIRLCFASCSDYNAMYAGQGVDLIKQQFAAARKHKRAIIFIDEVRDSCSPVAAHSAYMHAIIELCSRIC